MQAEELMKRGQDSLASVLVDGPAEDFIGVKRKPGAEQRLQDDKAARMFEMHASQNFKKVQAIQRMRLLLLLWVIRNKIKRNLKRVFDITVSLLALPFLTPIMLVTTIAIKLDSPGPILFRQARVGKWSKPFTCYKFRSMHVDAEERKKALLSLNEADQIIFKMKKDPRVTRVGRVIRKLSVDELPQIFNVIKGDMSLVGPRPPVPYEVDQYQYDVRRRLDVVPGITGLQQVSGRSDIEFKRWVELDLQYIQDQSLLKDIQILLKTIPTVLSGKGAY